MGYVDWEESRRVKKWSMWILWIPVMHSLTCLSMAMVAHFILLSTTSCQRLALGTSITEIFRPLPRLICTLREYREQWKNVWTKWMMCAHNWIFWIIIKKSENYSTASKLCSKSKSQSKYVGLFQRRLTSMTNQGLNVTYLPFMLCQTYSQKIKYSSLQGHFLCCL